MSRRGHVDGGEFTGVGAATLAAFRRAVGTRPRRWLVAVTLLLGLLAAVGVTAAGQPADRTFVSLANPVQSLMSVTLPFIGVLLAHDLLRSTGAVRLAPTLLAATLLAAAVAAFGVLVCAAALAIAGSGAAGRWDHTASVAMGGVLVQIVAQLVGTGLGLLLRPVVVACLATIVLPLGLWLVLGRVTVLHPAQAWLTPYAAVQHLLSGRTSALAWAQWSVVALLWAVGLNAVGAARLKRVAAGKAA